MRKDIVVIAQMNTTGIVFPLSIAWETGKTYKIDKILDIRKKASLKGGGMGIRYTCEISGKEKFLWLDGYVWFVEV